MEIAFNEAWTTKMTEDWHIALRKSAVGYICEMQVFGQREYIFIRFLYSNKYAIQYSLF
jgi:hypothetical protein